MTILVIIITISGLVWLNQRFSDNRNGFRLASPSFKNGGELPQQFTCEGEDISPEFAIRNIPKKAKTLAIIIEDLDINKKGYKDYPYLAQMVVWNIPVSTTKFTQGIRPPGTIGRNIKGNFAYNGPCPPQGITHEYQFTLFAISKDSLTISSEAGLAAIKKAVFKADIANAKLTANYTGTKKKK